MFKKFLLTYLTTNINIKYGFYILIHFILFLELFIGDEIFANYKLKLK